MQQKRLLIALIISTAILFLWTYFYPAPPASQKPGATPSPTASATATQQTAANAGNPSTPATTALTPNVSSAPQRTITVKTPLYDVKFDTLGAEPVSWIIKVNKNKQGQKDIYSVAGRRSDKKPLELISPEGLTRQPRLVPLQLETGDAAFDHALSSSTYKVEGVDQASGDAEVNVGEHEKKELTFVLEDSNGVQVRKKIAFDGESYETGLAVSVKRG